MDRKIKDILIHGLFLFNGLLVVIVLIGIFALLIAKSVPAFREVPLTQFLFTAKWNPTATFTTPVYGILTMVVSTFMVSLGALAIAMPLGIGAAAYLSDVADRRVTEIVKPIIEILAGIPSVVIDRKSVV